MLPSSGFLIARSTDDCGPTIGPHESLSFESLNMS